VTGTALGCGGYAVALLVYILNKGEYHPLVRPAILTSLLGYGLAILAVAIDLGRPWELWKVPVYFWRWTGSPQLEVALCVAAYAAVLLVELSPAAFERWRQQGGSRLRSISERLNPLVEKGLVWILALGMLLPTMHQSSLGTMMLLPGPRLHPLWYSGWVPLLFLVNAVMMGYAAVALESILAARAFGRPLESALLGRLSRVAYGVTLAWIALRVLTALMGGGLGALASGMGPVFTAELLLHVAAAVALLGAARAAQPAALFRAAMLLGMAGTAYRIDTYLVAFRPGSHWTYFPAVPELFITIGIVALEVVIYVAAVKRFPILAGAPRAASA
jgi:Ni/Fe-hydrogenase subunit HybB-like protein